jgi:hypothetical protein
MKLFGGSCGRYSGEVSEYIDGLLDDRETRRFEEHTAVCASCGRLVVETRQLTFLSQRLISREAPRSFALHPSMVREPRPVAVEQSPGRSRFGLPARPDLAMRYGGALASFALLSVLVVDLTREPESRVVEGPVATTDLTVDEESASAFSVPAEAATEPAADVEAATDEDAAGGAAEPPVNAADAPEAEEFALDSAPESGDPADDGSGDAADATALRQADGEAAGEGTDTTAAFTAPVLIEETSRTDVLLAAEIALAAVAAVAFVGSIVWAWRRRSPAA